MLSSKHAPAFSFCLYPPSSHLPQINARDYEHKQNNNPKQVVCPITIIIWHSDVQREHACIFILANGYTSSSNMRTDHGLITQHRETDYSQQQNRFILA